MKTHGSFQPYQFSPRESPQNVFNESPSPSHLRISSGTRQWNSDQHSQDEMFVNVSSPRSPSKKQSRSPRYLQSQNHNHAWTTKETSRGKLTVMSDRHRQPSEQLANIKHQWNARRDIPSGTVRNNPFQPKRESSPPTSPQLVHQKKQWDTADIPEGSVTSKAALMTYNGEEKDESRFPSSGTRHFHDRRSFGSSDRDDQIYPSSSPRISVSVPSSPSYLKTTKQKSRGYSQPWPKSSPSARSESTNSLRRAVNSGVRTKHEDSAWRQQSPLQRSPTESQPSGSCAATSAPSQMLDEQSPRVVQKDTSHQGKVASPFLQQAAAAATKHASERLSSWKPEQEIPKGAVQGRVTSLSGGTTSFSNVVLGSSGEQIRQVTVEAIDEDPWISPPKSMADVSVGDWGQAIQVKSDDSEEWDHPDIDWVQQPGRTIDSAENPDGFLEFSANTETWEESSSLDRDEDMMQIAARRKGVFDASNHTIHATGNRDMDILMAAKKKINTLSHVDATSGFDESHEFSTVFPGDTNFDKQAFPDNDAFGSSLLTMQGAENLSGSEQAQPNSLFDGAFEDTFYVTDPDGCDSPKTTEDRSMVEETNTTAGAQGKEISMKERKSIFSIFGVGRKEKGAKKSKSMFSFGSSKGKKTPINSQNHHKSTISKNQTRNNEMEDFSKERVRNKGLSTVNCTKCPEGLKVTYSPKQKSEQIILNSKYEDNSQEIYNKEALLPTPPPPPQTEPDLKQHPALHESHGMNVFGHVKTQQKAKQEHFHKDLSLQNILVGAECKFPGNPTHHMEVTKIEDKSALTSDSPREEEHQIDKNKVVAPESNQHIKGDILESESEDSSGVFNRVIYGNRASNVQSGSDWKRKTAKLRKYGEVNSRFKEHTLQASKIAKSNPPNGRTLKNSRYKKEVKDRAFHSETKSICGSRHAKIKYSLSGGSKVARMEDSLARNKMRSKARNYARQRAGFAVDDAMYSNSSKSEESVTVTLASAGSDIRVLRSLLRRPRCLPVPCVGIQNEGNFSEGNFPKFDIETLDPMQEAGLKMLSATIIPMQAQVRRFLAMRHALTRMWALIVIQANTRRWMAQKRFKSTMQSAVRIQAVIRGHLARDDLDFKHVCAIEIQRVMRGYMSTMKVYEDIYKITVVQSHVRMKQAMERTSWRMAHIVQLQSVFRGFLVRRRQEYQQICAIAIQANWRRFYHRLNYQFDLLDIIITQSVWRKKMAVKTTERIQKIRKDKASTVIQSKWRQHTCSSKYLQDKADIIIIQTTARRYLARERARLIREHWVVPAQKFIRGYLGRKMLEKQRAACTIQTAWRGFVSYADYMFSIADIVTVQKVARAWLARREANHARKLNSAATTIQSAYRVILGKALARRVAEVREMERLSREIAKRESQAAASIQSIVRRMQTQSAYKYYCAATKIQSNFRAMKSRQETLIFRGEILAATIIQSAWRGFISYTDYIFMVSDIITVQRVFRGHLGRSTAEGTSIRKVIKKRREQIAAATVIQKGSRGLLQRQRYWYTLGCTMQIQSWMRGRLVVLQLRREEKVRLKLQSFARRFLARQEYLQRKFIFMLIQTAEQERSKKVAALVIQEKARNYLDERRAHEAACIIQRFFLSVREEVDQLIRAAKRRKKWRKKKSSRRDHGNKGADDILEDAWIDTACGSNLENDSFVAQSTRNVGSNIDSNVSKDRSNFGDSRSSGNHSKEKSLRMTTNTMKKNLLPPTESDGRSKLMQNEFSKLTGSETTFYRLPPARMRRMDSRDMNDDLELEEAFMDTKICNAKNRRIADKKRTFRA